MNIGTYRATIILILAASAAMPARAQWAVVDAPAIAQLVHEVQMMQEEVQVTRNQLLQAQQALQTMTGPRGMERLLSGISRNYLPMTWTQLSSAMRGAGGFPSLLAAIRAAVDANAILTPQQLATLPVSEQSRIAALRQSRALQQALAQEALANSSSRFSSLQTLIAAIPSATDQKAVLDLQARIGAELGMLQNEQTKVQVLHQAMQAQAAVQQQQERELVIAGQGRFDTRFQPVP